MTPPVASTVMNTVKKSFAAISEFNIVVVIVTLFVAKVILLVV